MDNLEGSKPSEARGCGHVHAHVSICPDDQMHLRVGNVCLHLCRRDFCQLAREVMNTVAKMDAAERRLVVGEIH